MGLFEKLAAIAAADKITDALKDDKKKRGSKMFKESNYKDKPNIISRIAKGAFLIGAGAYLLKKNKKEVKEGIDNVKGGVDRAKEKANRAKDDFIDAFNGEELE